MANGFFQVQLEASTVVVDQARDHENSANLPCPFSAAYWVLRAIALAILLETLEFGRLSAKCVPVFMVLYLLKSA